MSVNENTDMIYPVKRDACQPEIQRLFLAIKNIWPDFDEVYGSNFENEIFWILPYYWGDCTCGWDYIDNGHEQIRKLKHDKKCCHYVIAAINDACKLNQKKFEKELKKYYQKKGWNTSGDKWLHECMSKCDCNYEENLKKIYKKYESIFGQIGHKKECLLEKANFFHKPSGFGIEWYKYPLRGAQANRKISLLEFRKIIDECIASLSIRKYIPNNKIIISNKWKQGVK